VKTLVRKFLSITTFGLVSWTSKKTLLKRQLRAQKASNRLARQASRV
jgi:hypothetical protein